MSSPFLAILRSFLIWPGTHGHISRALDFNIYRAGYPHSEYLARLDKICSASPHRVYMPIRCVFVHLSATEISVLRDVKAFGTRSTTCATSSGERIGESLTL